MESPSGRPRLRLFTVFFISLMAICAELCLALMLSLKSFSHMVYVVISFALLGYGLGSNLYLLLGKRLQRWNPESTMGVVLVAVSLLTFAATLILPGVPINLSMIHWGGMVFTLALVYALVALPFTGIGFVIALLFSTDVQSTRKLYFWDLLGAGLGAVVFFPLISTLGPLRSIQLLAAISLLLAARTLGAASGFRMGMAAAAIVLALIEGASLWRPEPVYAVDPAIGWEYIPGYFEKDQYEETWRTWHPLGRTDLHRMKGEEARRWLSTKGGSVTFEVCVVPQPEFCYFTNCYRAGTPVFALSEEYLRKRGCQVRPFSTAVEVPYVLLDRPKVLVIGAGGGRDLFMAGVHDASGVRAAEINPATFAAMAPGGVAHEYSGRVYTARNAHVENIDGRHLVKNTPPASQDLVILNGIDTFAALSTGAYAFAENYLYTQEAIVDYLHTLKPNGLINFNRWFEGLENPRDTLRLLLMSLDALRSVGAEDPSRHVLVGAIEGWGILLVKRSPFSDLEEKKVLDYFSAHAIEPVFRPGLVKQAGDQNSLEQAVAAFKAGAEKKFIDGYWADVSVVHDDNPFFYKYYRFTIRDDAKQQHPAGGVIAFRVQGIIILQTVVFILLFTFVPLMVFRDRGNPLVPAGLGLPFVVYFSALGVGFIFIEITLMQRFTLALGSPVYSISVSLATILVATGIGSLLSGTFSRWAGSETRMLQILGILVAAYLVAMVVGGTALLNVLVRASFPVRIGLSSLLLVPVAVCLGVFFPTGLLLVGQRSSQAVAWAWGINSGFTVLGSTVCIMIAQFLGFNLLLLISAGLYLIAPIAYRRLSRKGEPIPTGNV